MTERTNHTEETKILVGKRLRVRRLKEGLSIRELVKKLDYKVSCMAISKYENGKAFPSTEVMSALTKLLGIRAEDLLHPFNVEFTEVEFHKDTTLGKKKLSSIEKTVQSFLEQFAALMDECAISFKPYDIKKKPVNCEDDVIRVARELRKDWGIEDQFLSVIPFLENKGFILYEVKETDEDFDGISGKAGVYPIIVLRKNLNSEMKRFTALHELGHLILAFPENAKQSTIENYCHKFAQEMLLPTDKLIESIQGLGKRDLYLFEFAQLQRKYGIPIDIILKNAAQCKLISPEKLNAFKEKKERFPEFKQFAVKSRYTEETCEFYISTLYSAYTNKILSVERAAYYLNLNTVSFVNRYQVF